MNMDLTVPLRTWFGHDEFRPGQREVIDHLLEESMWYSAEPFLLSHEELATLWHPPTASVGGERVATMAYTERAPPATLPRTLHPGDTLLGRTSYRESARP
jgi:hypothetical protein